MGLMVGAHVTPSDHLGFAPKDPAAPKDRYEVHAIADGYIVNIQHRVGHIGDPANSTFRDEFRVVVEHSCTFWSYYDLIDLLDSRIVEQVGGIPPPGPSPQVRVPIKGGQVIGRFGGGHGIDFAVVDRLVTLPGFLVPSHYDAEPWKIHTVDPFDYYDEPLRSQLLAFNPRTALPRGGKIDFDVDGRLVGNWFKENTNGLAGAGDPRGPWIGHLAIVYHHIDPSKIVLSFGDFQGTQRQFWVKGNVPDPSLVSQETGPVKYELLMGQLGSLGQPVTHPDKDKVQGVLLAQIISDRKLKIETFVGKTAGQVTGFTSAALIYER